MSQIENSAAASSEQSAEQIAHKRLMWHSRRGMLELDVLLLPFCQDVYPTLSEQDKLKYKDLLDNEDPDLFGWFMQHDVPDNEDHKYMVEVILQRVQPA